MNAKVQLMIEAEICVNVDSRNFTCSNRTNESRRTGHAVTPGKNTVAA